MHPLTFAVGDIHGMYSEFISVMNAIEAYASNKGVADFKIVFLGDYIDRGSGSAQVVQHLIDYDKKYPGRCHFGRGNHEQMLMDAMKGGYEDLGFFIRNGGETTLYSYTVESPRDIPFSHKKFYRATRFHYEDDLRYFTHAGVNPLKTLKDQDDESRLWIREPFLYYGGTFKKLIVHGHTPRNYDRKPRMANRLNLDFGCVFGGSLVCAVFNDTEADPIDFIVCKSGGRDVTPIDHLDMK